MDASDLELTGRYETLIAQYAGMAPEVVQVLERFGKLRKELQMLSVEMDKRGLIKMEPEAVNA